MRAASPVDVIGPHPLEWHLLRLKPNGLHLIRRHRLALELRYPKHCEKEAKAAGGCSMSSGCTLLGQCHVPFSSAPVWPAWPAARVLMIPVTCHPSPHPRTHKYRQKAPAQLQNSPNPYMQPSRRSTCSPCTSHGCGLSSKWKCSRPQCCIAVAVTPASSCSCSAGWWGTFPAAVVPISPHLCTACV